MGYLKAIISACLGFIIEDKIVGAFTTAICQTGGAFWCFVINLVALILLVSGTYGLISLIFPNWNN